MQANLLQIKYAIADIQQQIYELGFSRFQLPDTKVLGEIQKIYERFSIKWQGGFYSTMMIEDVEYRKQVSEQLSKIVTAVLDGMLSDFEILFSNFLIKLPQSDNYIGVHQDWNFTDEQLVDSVNFWIPLEDVNGENGNLFITPASHRYFFHFRGTPYINYFKGYESAIEKISTPLYPKRGEVILYHGRALHFSRPNVSGKTRIAIGGVIIPKDAPVFHYRNNGVLENPVWEKYHVDKKFFESFTPEQNVIEGYRSEIVHGAGEVFKEETRNKVVLEFLSKAGN